MNRDLYIKARVLTPNEWVRPSDWLTMPTLTSSDDEFIGLYAIFPNGNNFASLTMTTSTGTYDVDWGDGTVDTVTSGTLAQHTYDYATYDVGNTTLTSRGYKQAFITVTANTGLFRTANFQTRRVTSPVQNQNYATGFLDIVCSFPNLNTGNSFLFGGTTITHRYLERFDCKSIGLCNTLAGFFRDSFQLQKILLFDTSLVTSFGNCFFGCYSLKEIPLFDTSMSTVFISMFNSCYSLKEIPLINTSNGVSFDSMFSSCYALKEIPLINTSSATTMVSMFFNCYALETVPLLDLVGVTNIQQMFFSCTSLKSVPFFNTSTVVNFSFVFNGCQSLQSIHLFDLSSATRFDNNFVNCFSLQSIPAITTPNITTTSGTDFTNFSPTCLSLDRCEMAFSRTVNIANCQLSQTALVEIFNNLVDRTATTSANINITGNWGASALTAGERLIATSKNWTITG